MSDVVLTQARPKSAEISQGNAARRRTAAVALLVAATYYLTAQIGFAFALQPGSVSTLWMPNSILLAGLLLVPKRSWWVIVVAALPAHLASEVQSGVPTAMVLSWFVSNSFQALFGAYFICRLIDGPLRFDKHKHLTVFLIFGALLAPVVSSFLDIALVRLNGWGNGPYWEIWRVRCLSNILATLTLVPAIVTWVNGGFANVQRASWKRVLEAAILTAGLLFVCLTVFNSHLWGAEKTPSLFYWPLPFLLWATVRFGIQGVSTALLMVMFLAIWGATHGEGPFVANSASANALSIQWFLIVISVPLMGLAAVIHERRHAESVARQNEEHLAMAMSAAQMGTWEWSMGDEKAKWSDETKRIFGRSPSDPETSNEEFYSWIHPDDRSFVVQSIERSVNEGCPYEAEFRLMLPDGTLRWVRGKGEVLRDETGTPQRMIGLNADITERKKAEQALRESEDRLARTEAFSLVMVTHVGLDGKWLKVPPTLCELLGYTEEELLSGQIKDVTHPDDLQAYKRECQRLIRGEIKSFDLEKRYIHKNGKTIWVYVNCSVVEDNDGNPVHFLNYIRDITDRRLAEGALRESEERYRSMLESQTELICRFLPDTRLTYVNDAYCRYFGKTREEMIGRSYTELMPVEIRPWATKVIESLLQDHGSITTEHEVLLPDGSIAWQQWVDHAIPGPDGKIVELQAIGRDVTERKRAEQALMESSERNQAILRANPDLMFLQSKEGVFLDYYARDPNELFVPPESFLGKSTGEVLPDELAERITAAFGQVDGTDEPQVVEYSLGLGGEERYFEARIVSADRDKVLTIVRNITESRRAAVALRESEEKLLQSNRQSRELAARLITAQESERRRIALLLHDDLSQNIAAMGVGISRLKRKPPSTPELMTAELDQLIAQTNGLTTQIRKLSHQLHPDVLEHVGLVAALDSEVAEFGHTERIKVEFSSTIKTDQVPLDISVCLYRVALEALRNVSRHSGAGSARVALTEDELGFTLEVSDSGQGFDLERAKRGSGLGLISAEERVKLLQGSFSVTSRPEGGTVLRVLIPITKRS
ncbi:MAG TPA: PAS domain S-box protein [Pyrinomonadaceae bacterium]|nr:PAS domain S-box protein [Pyrinomonadaceae bacterium]